MDYKQYQEEVIADITDVLGNAECQPILFVGSGFTKRYAKGPNWEELLRKLADACPLIDKNFAYYKQAYDGDLKKIGSVFTDIYHKWAWSTGRLNFPKEYFRADVPKDIFIKKKVSDIVDGLGPNSKGSYGSVELDAEIKALKNISPHAIVTTNYDEVLESLFPGYEKIIGQQILRKGYLSIGEIFKIHGCRSDPASIIINEADYERFKEGHKYLSAKLLTYFIEHPLLFIGYRAEDPNIKAILYDVDQMVRAKFQLIPNVYILEWDDKINEKSYPARDKVISIAPDVNIRVKSIWGSSFKWVFEAFGQAGNLERIDTKLLRALMARSVELIRSDIPKKHVEINFQQLEHAVESGEAFAKLFGITAISNPSQVNIDYKYTLTGVGKELGFPTWHKAHDLIVTIQSQKNFNIKATDNKYHIAIKPGNKSDQLVHRYTDAAVDLLRKVLNGEKYEIDVDALND